MTPFDFWGQVLRLPLSGNNYQDISPSLISFDFKGVPEIERRVQQEVASYGKQLGKVLEALQALSAATQTPLPEIDVMVARIEAIKDDSKAALRADAESALSRLKNADPAAWAALVAAAEVEVVASPTV